MTQRIDKPVWILLGDIWIDQRQISMVGYGRSDIDESWILKYWIGNSWHNDYRTEYATQGEAIAAANTYVTTVLETL